MEGTIRQKTVENDQKSGKSATNNDSADFMSVIF
jgi:hypothetical protein